MVIFYKNGYSNYLSLNDALYQIYKKLSHELYLSINRSIIIKNWLVGFAVVNRDNNKSEYESIKKLLKNCQTKMHSRQILNYCRFYKTYPQLIEIISNEWDSTFNNFSFYSYRRRFYESQKVCIHYLVNHLTYSHFIELIKCNDPTERAFYECQCMLNTLSPRSLRKQIELNTYESSAEYQNEYKMASLIELAITDMSYKKNEYYNEGWDSFDLYSKQKLLSSNRLDLFVRHLRDFLLKKYDFFLPVDPEINQFVKSQLFGC